MLYGSWEGVALGGGRWRGGGALRWLLGPLVLEVCGTSGEVKHVE